MDTFFKLLPKLGCLSLVIQYTSVSFWFLKSAPDFSPLFVAVYGLFHQFLPFHIVKCSFFLGHLCSNAELRHLRPYEVQQGNTPNEQQV